MALLNSRLLNFVYHFLSQEHGKSQAQVKTGVVKQLPAIIPGEETQESIIALVTKILDAKAANPSADISALERQIDDLVYALYRLSAKERDAIESANSL